MKIETQYDPGDIVFLMHNNKVISPKIRRVIVTIADGAFKGFAKPEISYVVSHDELDRSGANYIESKLFATKEELLASL